MDNYVILWLKTTFWVYLAGLACFLVLYGLYQDWLSPDSFYLFYIYLVLNLFISAGFALVSVVLTIWQKEHYISLPANILFKKYLPLVALPLLLLLAAVTMVEIKDGLPEIYLILSTLFLTGYTCLFINIYLIKKEQTSALELYTGSRITPDLEHPVTTE